MAKRKKIDIESLPSNNLTVSNEKRVEPIASGHSRKKGNISTVVRDMGNSIFGEIILPGVKTTLVDSFESFMQVVMDGVRVSIFGGETTTRRGVGHTSYNKRYRKRREVYRERRRRVGPEPLFDDIFFDHRREAELVLGKMMELVSEYGWVSIGDYYSLVGKTSNSYTHERYGWDDLRHTRIHFSSEGYLIALPDPDSLN